MADHTLAAVAPVTNSPGHRRGRAQYAATCSCGHVEIALTAGHAREHHERHAGDPQPHETPAGGGDG